MKKILEKKEGVFFFFLVLCWSIQGNEKILQAQRASALSIRELNSCWIAMDSVKALQQRAGQFKPNNSLTPPQIRRCPQSFSASDTACFPVCSQMADLCPLLSTGRKCHAVTSLRFGTWKTKTEVRKMHFSFVLITICYYVYWYL